MMFKVSEWQKWFRYSNYMFYRFAIHPSVDCCGNRNGAPAYSAIWITNGIHHTEAVLHTFRPSSISHNYPRPFAVGPYPLATRCSGWNLPLQGWETASRTTYVISSFYFSRYVVFSSKMPSTCHHQLLLHRLFRLYACLWHLWLYGTGKQRQKQQKKNKRWTVMHSYHHLKSYRDIFIWFVTFLDGFCKEKDRNQLEWH